VKLPWWLNPWRKVRRIQDTAQAGWEHAHRLQNALTLADQHEAEALDEVERLMADNARQQMRISELLAGPGATPVHGPGGPAPEFVLVGIDRGGNLGKRVYASRDLSGTSFGMTEMHDPPPRWKVGAVMAQMLTVDGAGYAEALSKIGGIWANQGQPALDPGRKGIGR
jgi:hypothetical protein